MLQLSVYEFLDLRIQNIEIETNRVSESWYFRYADRMLNRRFTRITLVWTMSELIMYVKIQRHQPCISKYISDPTLYLFQILNIRNCVLLYNYRLLMRSTHDYEDRVRYWLTDAEGGGQPIPDKVFMVMSRPKSKVYYCFIKLSGIYLHKDWNIHSYCFYRAR